MMSWSVLLLSVLLMTAATDHLMSQMITGRGPPENVTVVEVLTNALNVSWDPPEEEPSYYTVEAGTSNEITHDTFFLIEGLQPCTHYSIIVTSVYEDSSEPYPAFTDGTTGISVPPAPLSCWFDNIDTTSLTAYWSDSNIQCTVTNHNISWTSHVLWNDEEDTSGVASIAGDHYTVRNLKPYTIVTVSVAAATDAGYGPPTTCWNVTLQDIPGPPVILAVTASVGSAVVTWTPPEEANGIITEYMINAVNGEDSVSTSVDGTVLTSVVEDLKDCQTYDVTVQASTEAGWGPESEAWTISTSGPVPPPPELCWFSNITYSKMVINWIDLGTQYDLINNHIISWSWDVLWADEQGSNVTFSQDTSITLTDLQPYTNVTAQVSVIAVCGGVGLPTSCWNVTSPDSRGPPENVAVTTLFPSGRGPPENVAVVGEFTTALNVSWDPPEEEPSYYSVDDGTDNQVTYDTFFFIEGLQPCTFYSIIVTSVYRDTDETYPAVTDGSTSISVPPEPLCGFDNIETTSMTAFWSDPPIPCAITNHNMSWTSHVLWNDEEDTSGAASVAGDHYTVRNLKPYSIVTVSVAAATDAGYGPPTTCWHVTLQDNPGPPVIVDVTLDERLSSAVVTWTPPVRANGIIIEYMIDAVSERHSVSTFVVGTVLTAVVEDLQYCQTYDITVQASNEAGWGRYSNAWNISTCEMFDNKGMPDV